MTLNQQLRETRDILEQNGYAPAVRFLRRQGLSFTTARTTVREIQDNAPWFRRALRKRKPARTARSQKETAAQKLIGKQITYYAGDGAGRTKHTGTAIKRHGVEVELDNGERLTLVQIVAVNGRYWA